MTMAANKAPSPQPSPPIGGEGARSDHLAPVFAQYPIEVVSAAGVYLNTRDGRRILDLYGGHAVAALGYGHPRWLAALEHQAREVLFQTNAVAMEVRVRAASRLVQFCGLGLDTVFFVNSGAEANENALKMAFKVTGRSHVAAVEGGFHGRTAAAGAVTWGAKEKWYGFPRTPFDVSFIARGSHESIAEQVTSRTAAVIVEPVQGLAGAVDLGREFLAALRARCDEVGAVLIFDEVQCGMGRTGYPFAANMYGVTPDMITTAKALGSGFPCSALLLSDAVASALKLDALGTTFGAGPMACAVIEAVIETIESEQLLANVRARAAEIRASCVTGPVIGTQGAGFLMGLRTRRPGKEVQAELLQHDILAGTASDPNIVRLLPAYTLGSAHIAHLASTLAKLPP
jgi:acetylornithine/succinyldiaminopimelate/putrescine aminotransferase